MPGTGLNRDVIKYIAMFTMLLNHIAHVMPLPGVFLRELFIDLEYFTAPVMCYFLVEGYHYTHSKKQYAMRLGVFALISEILFCLAFTTDGIIGFEGMNMMFTLLLCFFILLSMERISNPVFKWLAVLALTLVSTCSDWAVLAPLFTVLFALAGKDREKIKTSFVVATVILGIDSFRIGIGDYAPQMNLLLSAGTMIGPTLAGFAIVKLYNGKRMERGEGIFEMVLLPVLPGASPDSRPAAGFLPLSESAFDNETFHPV